VNAAVGADGLILGTRADDDSQRHRAYQHINSQSLYGRGIVKVYFQPGADVSAGQAQVTAISQTVLKQLPAGITPPLVISYNVSSVPVRDLQISSDTHRG
jgi:multidrug efflux pump subunit AcrB